MTMQMIPTLVRKLNSMRIKGAIEPLVPTINKAKELLNITVPDIMAFPYLADYDGYVRVVDSRGIEITQGSPIMGYYYPGMPIMISRYDPQTGRQLENPELLLFILHELRHIYQYTYHHAEYYSHNAVGCECLLDKAEIDADAFAVAFMRVNTTYHPSTYMMWMLGLMINDGGRREQRVEQIESQIVNK